MNRITAADVLEKTDQKRILNCFITHLLQEKARKGATILAESSWCFVFQKAISITLIDDASMIAISPKDFPFFDYHDNQVGVRGWGVFIFMSSSSPHI